MDNFKVIAITSPIFYEDEADKINRLLSTGQADLVHIRKPFSSLKETIDLISKIKDDFHPRLKIHDHFEILDKFDLGGIHLNSRNPNPYGHPKAISKSIHNLEDIKTCENLDYFFLSPVFDSISKDNYKASFDLNELSLKIKGKKAIALGGVTPEKFPILKQLGFFGGALLGYFFPNNKNK